MERGKDTALRLLATSLDLPTAEFREGQWEAIDAIANRQARLMVVQRTGWGKSSVYFIATRMLRDMGKGPTLIISPLLALMRNQIEAAERLQIRAVTINSTNVDEWRDLYTQILNDEVDAILISPERLSNADFRTRILPSVAQKVGLLVVDEAHCVSDWGHDFRPDYRQIGNILRNLPRNMPVLCTTATANNRVVADVVKLMGDMQVSRGILTRDSLRLQVLNLGDKTRRLAWLATHLNSLPGTGIIYVLTKRDAHVVSNWLRQYGHKVEPYYSDVTHPEYEDSDSWRVELESKLLKNEIKALVATTALGMGYDKPDLGFVVHYQAPGSVVAYYQQIGRAGRAISVANAILMCGTEDSDIHEYFRKTAFPTEENVQKILDLLEEVDSMSIRDFESHLNLRMGQIQQVLKFLSSEEPSPVVHNGGWSRTPVPYKLDKPRIEHLTNQRFDEWKEIVEYQSITTCLMQYLATKLDDEYPRPCGKCENCVGQDIVPSTIDDRKVQEANAYLRRAEYPIEPKKQAAANAFVKYGLGGTIPKHYQSDVGRVLATWGDAGWGTLVKDGKHNGHFADELVEAAAKMIAERWKPNPFPLWLTCIPSNRHPELVSSFGKRLAAKLNVEFHPVIAKVIDNEPQKLQQNRFKQCSNLDGVFAIRPLPKHGPVLLVDDIIDSGWTLTIVSYLLKREGVTFVYPFALASTTTTDS
jgi:ATP-dependent DNA helicase RecQ